MIVKIEVPTCGFIVEVFVKEISGGFPLSESAMGSGSATIDFEPLKGNVAQYFCRGFYFILGGS